MARYDDQNRRLCTKTTRAGNPCRAPALKGGLVCNKHGGSLPNVKAKAARVQLEELVEPALLEAKDLLADNATPAAAKVALIRDILDRTGYKPILEFRGIPPVALLDEWIEELEAEQGRKG